MENEIVELLNKLRTGDAAAGDSSFPPIYLSQSMFCSLHGLPETNMNLADNFTRSNLDMTQI